MPFPYLKENDIMEVYSKVTKYTLVGSKPDRYYSLSPVKSSLICLRKDNEIYVFSPESQSEEWNKNRSVYGLDLGKLESIAVFDKDGEYQYLKRWNKDGKLIKDYVKGKHNRHNYGEPIEP